MAARKKGGGREAALKVASELFYARGIPNVSIEQIAEAAGLTKRAVYYHFPTKNDLVEAYLEAADPPALGLLKGLCRDAEPGLDRLVKLFDNLGVVLGAPTFQGCAFLRAATETDAGAQAAAAHKQRVLTWLTEQAEIGGLNDPKQKAKTLLLIIDGALAQATYASSKTVAMTAKSAAMCLISKDKKSPIKD